MGRGCTMDEWIHFEKLPQEGRVPNSSYWYVICRHCVRAFEQKIISKFPTKLTGRRSAMRAHLKICPVYGTQYKLEQSALAAAHAQVQAAAAAAAAAAAHQSHDANGGNEATAAAIAASAVAAATAATSSSLANEGKQEGSMGFMDTTSASSPSTASMLLEHERKKRKLMDDIDTASTSSRGGRGKHCMMEEWEHFIRLQDQGYIGKSNFFQAICKHCQKAYDEAPPDKKAAMTPPERMVGRREKLRKHLSLCPYFDGELPPLDRRAPPRILTALSAFRAINGQLSTLAGSNNAVAAAAALAAANSALGLNLNATDAEDPSSSTAFHLSLNGNNNPSAARLALDEWQFFTRLNRKKDSAYYFARCNFCQEAYENAPEAVKSAMEPTIVMGRKSNMQTHLAKCPNIPKEVPAFLKTIGLEGAVHTPEDVAMEEPPSTALAKHDWYEALMQFTLEHNLAFPWVESASAIQLFRVLRPQVTEWPRASELEHQILDYVYTKAMENHLCRIKEATMTTPNGSSANSNGFKSPAMLAIQLYKKTDQVPSLSSVLITQKDVVALQDVHLLSSTSSSNEITAYHGLEVARYVERQLRLCHDPIEIPARVVFYPPTPVWERAMAIVRHRSFQDVLFLSDWRLLLVSCLQKALELHETTDLIDWAIQLTSDAAIQTQYGVTNDTVPSRSACIAFLRQLVNDWKAPAPANDSLRMLVDAAIAQNPTLLRTLTLLDALETAVQRSREGSMHLVYGLVHLSTIFEAADGWDSMQESLEALWMRVEQPLFVLAHALHPQWRLKDLASSDLTKWSAISDLAVHYFGLLFGRKPTSLRGDVTAYLHESQHVFSRAVVSEFAMVDDYFRYLSDDYGELAMLMRALATFPVSFCHKMPPKTPKAPTERKVAFLKEQYGLSTEEADDTSPVVEPLDDGTVLHQWASGLQRELDEIDTTAHEVLSLSIPLDDLDDQKDQLLLMDDTSGPLPSLDQDDPVTFPSMPLRGARGKKVPLRELFPSAQATI